MTSNNKRGLGITLAYLGVALAAWLDFITGPEISFSIFYMVPISIIAWFYGKTPAVIMSFVGAILWFEVDRRSGGIYSHPLIPYWNASVRLIFFLMSSFVVIYFRQRANEEVFKNSREQLRQLAEHLQAAREEERIFIAREVHDELGQELTGLKLDLDLLEKSVLEQKLSSNDLPTKIKTMEGAIDKTIQQVRKIATALRPGILDHLGLTAAIEWQAKEFEKKTGIYCQCDQIPDEISMDKDRAAAIFRIFQEVLVNIKIKETLQKN